MKFPFCSRTTGFTLIEMLIVIAIIGVVVTASVGAIKSAQRQARTSKCSANMHALHQAVLSYYADTGHFPPAESYEVHNRWRDLDGKPTDHFNHMRGWVSWVRASPERSRRASSGNLYNPDPTPPPHKRPADGPATASKASSYTYVGPGCGRTDQTGATAKVLKRVARSIDEGAIFKYTDGNFSIFCCEEFREAASKATGVGKEHIMRSYAMNYKYGSRRHRLFELCRAPPGDVPSRLAMFVEMGEKAVKNLNSGNDCGDKRGESGMAVDPVNVYYNDPAWDWRAKNSGDEENIGVWHRRAGRKFGHVMFADGHLESLEVPMRNGNVDQAEAKKQREALGDAAYGAE